MIRPIGMAKTPARPRLRDMTVANALKPLPAGRKYGPLSRKAKKLVAIQAAPKTGSGPIL